MQVVHEVYDEFQRLEPLLARRRVIGQDLRLLAITIIQCGTSTER